MHLLTAFVAFAATVLYSHRTGELWPVMPAVERLARGGLALVLATLVVGFIERWRLDSEFLWIHWLILAALAATVGGYLGLLISGIRAMRR